MLLFALNSLGTTNAETRIPLVFQSLRRKNIYSIQDVNLLTSTLSAQSSVIGTLNKTNNADTSSAAGSPVGTGSLARTNADDTSSAVGSPIGIGSLARTNNNDTSSAVGTTTIVGTLSYTNNNDSVSASGTVLNAAPFVPFDTSILIQKRRVYPIVYGSRGINAGAPIIPTDPFVPNLFFSEVKRKHRVVSFDFPNILTSTLEYQPIASSYPEHVFIQKRKVVNNIEFPNLVIFSVTTAQGTLNRTNNNDTNSATGNTTLLATLSRTNANDTSSATGSPVNNSSSNTTNNNDTIVSSGTTSIVGSLGTTNSNDTLAASGSADQVPTGTLNKTNNNDTSAGQGSPVNTSTLAITNNNDTLSAFGTAGIQGGVTTRLPLTGVGV